MKQFVFILFIGLFSFNSFGQDIDLPKNPKPGKCYVRCIVEDNSYDWKVIDCKLMQKFKVFAKDSVKLKTLQIKLSNLSYDVDVSGKTDLKTIAAYKQYTKDEKKRLRKAKKKRKKTKQ